MVLTDIGAKIRAVAGIVPTNAGATATINGAAVNRLGFLSGVLRVDCGAAVGAPTAISVTGRLQHSPDGVAGWVDVPGASIPALTAVNTGAEANVSFSPLHNFIRAVVVVTLTGGTTPTLPVSATLVLGGAVVLPVL